MELVRTETGWRDGLVYTSQCYGLWTKRLLLRIVSDGPVTPSEAPIHPPPPARAPCGREGRAATTASIGRQWLQCGHCLHEACVRDFRRYDVQPGGTSALHTKEATDLSQWPAYVVNALLRRDYGQSKATMVLPPIRRDFGWPTFGCFSPLPSCFIVSARRSQFVIHWRTDYALQVPVNGKHPLGFVHQEGALA